MFASFRTTLATLATVTLGACSFTSTATHWNGCLDAVGHPVFLKATTNVGVNFLVFLPLIGNTTIDRMIDQTSREIAEKNGTRVRVVQTSTTNYGIAYYLLTFPLIISPVVTDVTMEYEPSWEELVTELGLEQATALMGKQKQAGATETPSHEAVPGSAEAH